MISIIVIGKNEGLRLTKCLESIYEIIEFYSHLNFEVIYVDSKSDDDSILRAMKFSNIQIFKITGKENAAFARNIGAKEAKGEILFFVDGDMELNKDFLSHAVKDDQLIHDCLTGHIDDYLYDKEDNFLSKKSRTYKSFIPKEEIVIKSNGGIFLVKKEKWNAVSGMRTKYRRSQDIDFTIRLAEIGTDTIRIPSLIAKHHTISYLNEGRMWKLIKDGNLLYPALIFRDHIKNISVLKKTLRSQYSSFLLIFLFDVNNITVGTIRRIAFGTIG